MAIVLVIDDDPQICDVLQQVLREEGHVAFSALNGVEGISQCRQYLPKLVFVDMLMPEKEGLETILELRREFPHVMIIAMSGASEGTKINLLELAQQLGAQYRLIKPFRLETVVKLVNSALGKPGDVS